MRTLCLCSTFTLQGYAERVFTPLGRHEGGECMGNGDLAIGVLSVPWQTNMYIMSQQSNGSFLFN